MDYQNNFQPVHQMVQWADNVGTMRQNNTAVPVQQPQMPMFVPEQLIAYQQLAMQYTELMDTNLEMKKEYQAALQKISNFELGMRGTDFELLEDVSAARMYLAKGSSREILAEILITSAQIIWLQNPKGENFCAYSIQFEWGNGNGGNITISERELDSPKFLMQAFEKANVAIMVSRSEKVKHTLLRRLIMKKVDDNIVLLPYLSGWSDGVFKYVTIAGSQKLHLLGAEAPSLKRNFAELQMTPQNIQEVIANGVSCFGGNLAMLLFSVAIGAILYSPLSAAGFYPESLFAIDSRKKSAKEARKFLQIWGEEIRIPLSQGKYLAQNLCQSKDEVIFVEDENTAYARKMREKFLSILHDREILNPADGSIVELQTVPILLTGCVVEWADFYDNLLSLPLPDGVPKGQADRRMISSFYRFFVDWMNVNFAWLPEMISKLVIKDYQGKERGTYCWIMAANQILEAYLDIHGVASPVKSMDFEKYLKCWMEQAEYMCDLTPAEKFVENLRRFKSMGGLHIAKIEQYKGIRQKELTVYFDEDFIYVPSMIFQAIVDSVLPGYNYAQVYQELVKIGHASGERGHVFPKITVALGQENGNQRVRMAKLQKHLLLSDEESLLEV